MFPIESFKNALLKFVEILNRQEIPFHLTGGITGVAYGEPRLTQDIDIVIQNATSVAKLDVYPREMIEGELSRSQELEIFESVRLPIASRLDAAVSKLIWSSKGSHKSRRDFRQIFIRSSEAENERVREMANKLGLENLLDEVIAESDEITG